MKPSDLYRRAPKYTTRDLSELIGFYYNHVAEFFAEDSHCLSGQTDDRVEIKVARRIQFDHRRFWQLATVWFDGAPVMVIQNAGRGGDDHHARFITDADAYAKMGAHLVATFKTPPAADVVAVSPNDDLPLDRFYNTSLDFPLIGDVSAWEVTSA